MRQDNLLSGYSGEMIIILAMAGVLVIIAVGVWFLLRRSVANGSGKGYTGK